MSIVYNGAHSVNINVTGEGGYNTWKQFALIPASRPFISRAAPNVNLVPLPGTSKFLDFTDNQPGGLNFNQRTGEWKFIVDYGRWANWYDALNYITEKIQGKSVTVTLDDDPDFVYTGRVSVSDYSADSDYSTITISYTLQSAYPEAGKRTIKGPKAIT